MKKRSFIVAALLLLLAALAASPVQAGYVTGAGTSRTAHLFDSANGLEATVPIPEVFEGYAGNSFNFTLKGTALTASAAYRVAVVVSPGSDIEARWNATGTGPAGNTTVTVQVTIPPDTIQGTQANAPFAVELYAGNGTLLDSTVYSVDLRYREPPADGGLFQLAIATTFFWGAVLLYAFHLQRAQRKLRSRADALERSLLEPGGPRP
jgi:hypothetical protein